MFLFQWSTPPAGPTPPAFGGGDGKEYDIQPRITGNRSGPPLLGQLAVIGTIILGLFICAKTDGCKKEGKERFKREIEYEVYKRTTDDKIEIFDYTYVLDKRSGNYFCDELRSYDPWNLAWYSAQNKCFFNPKTKNYDIPLYHPSNPNLMLNPKTRKYERHENSELNQNNGKEDNKIEQKSKFQPKSNGNELYKMAVRKTRGGMPLAKPIYARKFVRQKAATGFA